MNNTSLITNTKNFESHILISVDAWFNLMLEQQYQEASDICTNIFNNYSFLYKNRNLEATENQYNRILVLLILIKALEEYVQLCEITQDVGWCNSNETVEKVWIKLCDCRERLNFSSVNCKGEVISKVTHCLNEFENFFQERFGQGNYLSPGIIADKYLCNICNKDFRSCSHITGRIYNGRVCSHKLVNPRINHVALVKAPKDKRCRIWPWQIKDNEEGEGITIDKACILTSFRVDNFLM